MLVPIESYMIGKIRGRVEPYPELDKVLLMCGGVGYLIHTIEEMSAEEDELYIYEVIKEAEHTLYGFRSVESLQYFTFLLSINGVGPKSAFLIMRSYTMTEVLTEPEKLKSVRGVGEKTISSLRAKQ